MARKPNGQYAKGSNGYTEGTPKRVESLLPKEPRSLLRVLWSEAGSREVLLQNLREMMTTKKACAAFFSMSADYLEGSPKKTVEHSMRQQPRFVPAPTPAALTPPPEEPV